MRYHLYEKSPTLGNFWKSVTFFSSNFRIFCLNFVRNLFQFLSQLFSKCFPNFFRIDLVGSYLNQALPRFVISKATPSNPFLSAWNESILFFGHSFLFIKKNSWFKSTLNLFQVSCHCPDQFKPLTYLNRTGFIQDKPHQTINDSD